MNKHFLLLSFFALTTGFGTIIDRIERIEREMDQYKETKTLETLDKESTPFSKNEKWCHLELYPEFVLMQVKKDGKEQGLVYLGSVFGKDWSSDLEQDKQQLPWGWGYKMNASIAFPSYDITGSFFNYQNRGGYKESDQSILLREVRLQSMDLCLGYKKNGWSLFEFKRSLGVKKISIDTHQSGETSTSHDYIAQLESSFDALGPVAKLELKINLFAGMNVQGGIAGSIVYGKENSTRSFLSVDHADLLAPLETQSSTLIPSFDFKVGGGWDLVDEKNVLVSLSVGYEAHYYYLNHPMNHLGESLASLITVNFDKQNSLLSDLTMFGTVIRLETKF